MSESQFNQVLNIELDQMMQVWIRVVELTVTFYLVYVGLLWA